MDRGVWQATVQRVTKNQVQLNVHDTYTVLNKIKKK